MAKISALATFTCFTGTEMVVFNKGEKDPATGKPIAKEVPDNLAQHYIDAGMAELADDKVALSTLTKPLLIALAKEEAIDIDPSKTKPDIIAAIEAARAAKQAENDGGGDGDGQDGEGGPPA